MHDVSARPPLRVRPRVWPHRVVVIVLILAGAIVMLWPVAETIEGNREGAGLTTEYVTSVRNSSPEELRTELRKARAYNAALPPTALTDPWVNDTGQDNAAHNAYLSILSRRHAMGRLIIPAIKVDLPILHDADRLSMSFGVGHMYGSSLPVGGPGSHAVLAAHTGLRGRTMFDRLPELTLGQPFRITVAGTTLNYRIDLISVVEPWELEAVQRVPSGEYVTLVTCYTPPGGHKERLLVRGVRQPNGPVTTTVAVDTAADPVTYDAGIQSWMWPRIGGGLLALGILAAMIATWIRRDRKARRKPYRAVAMQDADRPTDDHGHTRTRTFAR